jgi:hypothetical protein
MSAAEERVEPKDRLFNPSRIPVTDEACQLVGEVLALLGSVEGRQKRRRAKDQAIHERAVSALVCALAHRYLHEPTGWLAVELSKGALSTSKRRAPFMTEQFATLVKFLSAPGVGLVELRKGDQLSFGGRRSTIRASSSLRQRIDDLAMEFGDFGRDPALLGEPLELRTEKVKKFLDGKVVFKADKLRLPDNEQVSRMRLQMQEINSWISAANLAWHGSALDDKVDVGKRFLKRIFNNGSLEAGGRLYGGFWQPLAPSSRLSSILIDDEFVVSLDFAQSALRMAYAQVGAEPPPGDLYAISGLRSYRDETKWIINALLSSDEVHTRFPRQTRGRMPKSWKFERVYSAIARHHEPITPLFGSSSGLRFMYQESEILIRTLLRLKSMGIIALPIHDCVLVARRNGEMAKAVMEESFQEVIGVSGVVEMEGNINKEDCGAAVGNNSYL